MRIDVLEALRLLFDRESTAICPNTCPGTASGRTRSHVDRHVATGSMARPAATCRYSTENRNWFETDFPQFLEEAGKPLDPHDRSDEHASHIIEALETGRIYRGHFNVKNGGLITNLPEDCIIEIAGLRRPFRPQHGRRHHPARGLRRHLHRLDQRAADVGPGRDDGDVDS